MAARTEGTSVWKYVLDPFNPTLTVKRGAKILTAREQQEQVCVWALVNPHEDEHEEISLSVYGTGSILPADPGTYIGTAHLALGALVLHVFWKKK